VSVFLAIDLDEPVRRQVSELIEAERQVKEKWLAPEKLHLTLVFLGAPEPTQLERFPALVQQVAQEHAPFTLSLAAAGTFGTRRAPSVLWLGVEGATGALADLHRDAARALLLPDLKGVTADERERPYRPHVTLARSKSDSGLLAVAARLAGFRSLEFRVSHLTLYESRPERYQPLFRVNLGPA
jgi:2'-5' RNA ligase